eukprot:COSAG01_NODE_11253_length_1970_cov_28.320513_1_plen_275_part_10
MLCGPTSTLSSACCTRSGRGRVVYRRGRCTRNNIPPPALISLPSRLGAGSRTLLSLLRICQVVCWVVVDNWWCTVTCEIPLVAVARQHLGRPPPTARAGRKRTWRLGRGRRRRCCGCCLSSSSPRCWATSQRARSAGWRAPPAGSTGAQPHARPAQLTDMTDTHRPAPPPTDKRMPHVLTVRLPGCCGSASCTTPSTTRCGRAPAGRCRRRGCGCEASNGCLNDAPCSPCTRHGASITSRFGRRCCRARPAPPPTEAGGASSAYGCARSAPSPAA